MLLPSQELHHDGYMVLSDCGSSQAALGSARLSRPLPDKFTRRPWNRRSRSALSGPIGRQLLAFRASQHSDSRYPIPIGAEELSIESR